MKMIKEGVSLEEILENIRNNKAWAGKEMGCFDCNSRFRMEKSDEPTTLMHYGNKIYMSFKCPKCRGYIVELI